MLGLKDYLLIGKLVAILALLGVIAWQNSQIHRWHVQSDHCAEARKLDRQSYETAQKQAQVDNAAHVQQIESQQQRITDATKDAYQRDHAELVRLRQQQLAAPKGPTSGAGPSSPPAPTSGANGDELHLSADQHLQAQEIELRLLHLQRWVAQQLAVDPNAK